MTLTEQYALACLPTLLAARAERINGGLMRHLLDSYDVEFNGDVEVDADGCEVEYENEDDIPGSEDDDNDPLVNTGGIEK